MAKDSVSNAERVRRYYRTHKAEIIEKQRRKRAANPEKYRAITRRSERKRRLRKYGLTLEEYQQLIESQGRVCAICRQPNSNNRDWHVDHCHVTNKVRGLLCHHCNLLLGNAKDSILVLESAIEYLEAA